MSITRAERTNTTMLEDPRTLYRVEGYEPQSQEGPGVSAEMSPKPDHGERSYVGTGRLAGRKALVTGGDSGIGRAVAIAYAREGADVAITFMQGEERDADEVRELVERAGRSFTAIETDLSDEQQARDVVRSARDALDGLDLVVLVAGKQQSQEFEEISSEQLEQSFRTNVHSLLWSAQEAAKVLEPGASIITTSSVQATGPSESLVDYAATKAAITNMSQALAKVMAKKGVRVNSVAPGPVWTPLQVAGGQPPEALAEFGSQTALGRAAQPAELAGAYVFLASNDASFVVGETITVDGGM